MVRRVPEWIRFQIRLKLVCRRCQHRVFVNEKYLYLLFLLSSRVSGRWVMMEWMGGGGRAE